MIFKDMNLNNVFCYAASIYENGIYKCKSYDINTLNDNLKLWKNNNILIYKNTIEFVFYNPEFNGNPRNQFIFKEYSIDELCMMQNFDNDFD